MTDAPPQPTTTAVNPPHAPHDPVASFPAGYFALVMATGIVSIAAHNRGWEAVAWTLLVLNVGFFSILVSFQLVRLLRYPRRVLGDMVDHERGPGFFTIVAGSCILGGQFNLVADHIVLPRILWWVAVGLWGVIMYTFFTATIVRQKKPSLQKGINGAWLVAIVATQAVATLGALLAGQGLEPSEPILLFTLCMYLLGAMLYVTIITLIFYRVTFLALPMERLTPPYWINMGAMAITTLAGSTLLLRTDAWEFLQQVRPFLIGFTLFFWSSATWWIPLLLTLGVWRHVIRRYPFRYDPQYWSMVFPLGMYCVCTYRLSVAAGLPFLEAIPRVFFFLAAAAWVTVFTAMVRHLWSARRTEGVRLSPGACAERGTGN